MERETGTSIRKEYALTINMAKKLWKIENNDKGRTARKYFIEMEKLAKEHQISLPTQKELAQMVIDAENKNSKPSELISEGNIKFVLSMV